ncbi:hypothetical protein HYQ44_011737 [Verticillium longisporum]|nr:hypothetical protein HYQ44_011737 [Verticillium longisporum]
MMGVKVCLFIGRSREFEHLRQISLSHVHVLFCSALLFVTGCSPGASVFGGQQLRRRSCDPLPPFAYLPSSVSLVFGCCHVHCC